MQTHLKTLLDKNQTLPDGLWLVKWIDRFSLRRGFTNSPRVRVFLQKLAIADVRHLERLSQQEISYLIGKRPKSQERLVWESHDVMAGMLPLLCMGDILRERRVIGQLRQLEATITIPPEAPTSLIGISNLSPPPKDWGDAPHRVLNRFEYDLGNYEQVRGAKCLCVRTPRMEYLFPATVILKTFYAFHTRVANAILSGPWEIKCREVISTLKYESGIGTYIDPATGYWNIVLQPGLTREHAVRLALLYFDQYARQCANAIHSSALQQTHGRRADDERFWFADAQIPFRWTDEPFQMRLRGFPLRPHRPPGDVTRFIVTRIEATSWPLVDQIINSELANSNALSGEPEGEKLNKSYYKPKPPAVPVREDVELNHQADAYVNAADNQAAAEDFRFLNAPLHRQQIKRSHKEYLGAAEPIRSQEAPSPVVSAGNLAPGEQKPAPLVADSKDRHPCRQLQYLLNALDVLVERHAIEGFEVLGPPEDSRVRIIRNNVACWSFLTDEEALELRAQRKGGKGWAFLFDRPRGAGLPRRAFPRCLLVIQVTVHGQQLLLFEVEPRLSETGYRLYVCEPTEALEWTSVLTALTVLREYKGSLDEDGLAKAFKGLPAHSSRAVNHFYERDKSERIVGLNADALYRALERNFSAITAFDVGREEEHSRSDQDATY